MAKFRDLKDASEGLKNQIKFENDKVYLLRFPEDDVHGWWEIWPVFPTADGTVRRRFVSNSDEDSSNLRPIGQFKKDVGIPEGLSDRDAGNWKNGHRYATVVITGTEVVVKTDEGKKRKIQWDYNSPKVWVFGIEVYRQLKGINNNTDLIDRAEEKKLDMAELNCTDVYALRVTRTKKGAQAFEVDYDVQAGRLVGQVKENAVDLSAIKAEVAAYIKPSAEADIEAFLTENSGGSSSKGEEADSVEEVAGEDDIDVDDETPPAKKGKGKAKATPEPEEEEEEEPAPAKKGKGKAKPTADDDDIDISDIDDILDE